MTIPKINIFSATICKNYEATLDTLQIEKTANDERPWEIYQKQKANNPERRAYLPVEHENQKGISRWYRVSDQNFPGIVIDSGQKKHIFGDLFGHYQGKRKSMFSHEDSDAKALTEILDSTLQDEQCEPLNQRPPLDIKGTLISKSITVEMNRFKYPKITIQDPIFLEESDAWYIHFYPEKY
jgi:hypothetical protein